MATSTVEKAKGQIESEKQDKVVMGKEPEHKLKMNNGNLSGIK